MMADVSACGHVWIVGLALLVCVMLAIFSVEGKRR